jgi:hypothetical protein
MGDFNTMFPNFTNQCLSLKTLLTPVAFVLITGGLISSTIANHPNGMAQLQSIAKVIVFVVLLVFLPTWGNQIVSIVSDTVTNVLKVNPAQIHDQYQAALQLKKSSDGNSSWWEKLIHFPDIMEGLISAFFIMLGWLASVIEWWAYILQTAILFIGYALSPIFIGMMAFPSLRVTGGKYLFNLVGIMLWPLGWGVAGLITQGMIDFMTDQSFLSASPGFGVVGSDLGYSFQNLMGVAFLGIWIIFSTIAAPTIIQKTITNGISAASGLISGAFAAGSAAGTAGIMSLASSIGGKSISLPDKDTFSKAGLTKALSQEGLKQAASAGVSAAAAGIVAGAAAFETLVTASLNEGRGGSSLIGGLGQVRDDQNSREGFAKDDPSGDQAVADLIRKSKNPDSPS